MDTGRIALAGLIIIIMLAALGVGIYLIMEQDTSTSGAGNQADAQLCDTYTTRLTIESPSLTYYDGILVIHYDPSRCVITGVDITWDYVPSRPMSAQTGLIFKVYFDGRLVYEGSSNEYDFNDYDWNGKEVYVKVELYRTT